MPPATPATLYLESANEFAEVTASRNGFAIRRGARGALGQTSVHTFQTLASAEMMLAGEISVLEENGFRKKRGKAPALTVFPMHVPRPLTKGMVFEDGEHFVELIAMPKQHTIRRGLLGTTGTTTKQKFASARASHAAYMAFILDLPGYRKSAGDVPYALIAAMKREPALPASKASAAPAVASDAKLEAAIAADPDRDDAYLVYGDWLQTRKDPRGELIVLQHANKSAAATRLLKAHAEHFFGPLAGMQALLEPSTGRTLLGAPTTWRWGYLTSVFLGNRSGFDDIDLDEVLGRVLDHPSARFLRELTLGINTFADNTYAGVAKVIGQRSLPLLRKLTIGDFDSDESELEWSELGNLEPLYKAVPNLESLTLRSGSMKLGKLALPKLRELRILTCGLDTRSLASITGQKWPHLEVLNLQIGDTIKPAIKLAHLAPIFAATNFPKVTHLGLGNSELADEIATELPRSKIAAQLEHLDLSEGTLGDEGAVAIAARPWRRLTSIDVHDSWLTKRGTAALKKLAKRVDVRGQQDDAGDPQNRTLSGNT